jgi:uncharacterized protein DUF1553/uncharacterized protein DUF1549
MAVVAGFVLPEHRPAHAAEATPSRVSGVPSGRRVDQRYAAPGVQEVPDFRRHLLPLLGRLGCSGRACHGSFQGQGGFRLSLFGYDFQADHQALLSAGEGRVDLKDPKVSLLLAKPTLNSPHAGGRRMEAGSWQYHLIRRWIESGARGVEEGDSRSVKLEITPGEIVFSDEGQRAALRVLAHWSDGSVEDVTPLCRYQTNDESIAEVDADGVLTSKDRGDTHVVAFYDGGVAVAPVLRPVSEKVGPAYPVAFQAVPAPTKIDALIVAKLRKLGIVPAPLCSDTEFLRRVSLDMTGTLPTPVEIEAFLRECEAERTTDHRPPTTRAKGGSSVVDRRSSLTQNAVATRARARKIDELLTRPTYVARWTTKLCDITGNSPRQFDGTGPAEEYSRQWYAWIARRVRENVPYDQLVAGIVLGRSRRPGQSYPEFIEEQSAYYREKDPSDFTARETMPYYWAKHTSRTPEERALNFSYAFLGVRIDCAQCHKHPLDRWTQADFKRFTAFFDTIGFGVAPDGRKTYQELIARLGDQGNQNQRERARLLRAQKGEVVPWREVFLAPRGTRLENGKVVEPGTREAGGDRVIPRVLGGEEVDLDRIDDPRQALMDWMRRRDNPYFARVFINRVWAEYFGVGIIHPPDDMNLANPPGNAALLDYLAEGFIDHGFDMKWLHREIATSQAYQRSLATNDTNRLDERNFSRAVARRLPAEVLFDAIAQATAGSAELTRATTDVDERAIGPRGGAFVGRRSYGDYASRVFGRSPRDTNCDCSASIEPNLLQAIYMQNDKEVLAALDRKGGWLEEMRSRLSKAPRETALDTGALVTEAFLRTVGRPPTAAEAQRCGAHFREVGDPVEGLHELLWVLLNTREFITNH